MQLGQHIPVQASDKFRVGQHHFGRELDFVDNALTGAVSAGKQLKILEGVVKSIAAYVMNGFVPVQLAAKVLFHNVAVFKNFVGRISVLRRDVEHGVLSLHSPRRLRQSVLLPVDLTNPLVLTLFTAKFLLVIKIAAARSPSSLAFLSAVFANKSVSKIGVFSSPNGGARNGAVQRVAPEFLSIRRNVRRHHLKWFLTLTASEIDRRNSCGRSPMFFLVLSKTKIAAKAATALCWLHVEGVLAVLAGQRNGHLSSSLSLPKHRLARLAA